MNSNTKRKTTFFLSTLSTLVATATAFSDTAVAVDDFQSEVYSSAEEVPCNSFTYPVTLYINQYKENAGDPQRVLRGLATNLTVTGTRSTSNSITDTQRWQIGGEVSLKWAPDKENWGGPSFGGAYISIHSVNTTNTSTFSNTQQVEVTSLVDGMIATPIYFKEQFQADYYKKDRRCHVYRVTYNRAMRGDVVRSVGWDLRCGDRTCVAGKDYVSRGSI